MFMTIFLLVVLRADRGTLGIYRQSNGNLAVTNATSLQTATTSPAHSDSTSSPHATDVAARIISETAHDLRSPLTTIRESVRLVRDGDLGEINDEQRFCLSDAINQCDCVDQMVGEMLQLDRLRNGLPRVHRDWIPVTELRQSIDETLRPWSLPRNIRVVWDGADDPNLTVFADRLSLRRLVVNLVANAIRATKEGASVLIELCPMRRGEALKWTVIDRGSGISESDLQKIASQQVTDGKGEGLGLMISRQLAALHFSTLHIRSRLGSGTEVSFETPACGPNSVASCWLRWRKRMSTSDQPQSPVDSASIEQGTSVIRPPQRDRLRATACSIEITRDGVSPRCENAIAVGSVAVGAAMSREAADQFDNAIQSQLRMFELAYRVEARRWVWIFDADEQTACERIESITEAVSKQIASVRLKWSDAHEMAVHERRTSAKLRDLLVRETLSASSAMHVRDNDEVRLGTAPIEPSDVASERLEEEIRRLSSRLKGQTEILRQQARKLRPRD